MPLIALFAIACPTLAQGQAAKQPNIIMIMGDDIGWANIGAYNQLSLARTQPRQQAHEFVEPIEGGDSPGWRCRYEPRDHFLADGHHLRFESEFDAVFSNAVLHWMKQPDEVIAGVWRALRPGGRFVAEMGGAGNVAGIVAALEQTLGRTGIDARPLNPWYFSDAREYEARLRAAGFEVESIELFERPTGWPGHIRDWLDTFAQPFLGVLAAADRSRTVEEVCAVLAPQMLGPDGVWTTDYVRLRFRAVKPREQED